MATYKPKLDSIIWAMISGWLIIDLLTGVFLNKGIFIPISQIYKFVLLILVSIKLLKVGNGSVISLWIIYVAVVILNCSLLSIPIGETIVLLSKFILTYLLYIFFNEYSKSHQDIIIKSRNILLYSFILVALNILLGLVGIGYHTYPLEEIGFKGFFFAGNELGGVLAVLTPFFLYYMHINYNKVYYAFSAIFCVGLSVLLGTKAFILISIISPILILWLLGTRSTKIRILVMIFCSFLIIIPLVLSIIDSNELDVVMRLNFIYDKGGITSLIFSGRDEFWAEESSEFYEGNIMNRIFGLGGNRTVEMDNYDILLNYGYFGIIIIYSLIFILFRKSIKNRHKNSFSQVVILINILLLGMSFIAGHIIFSSMAGMYISLVNVIGSISTTSTLYEKKRRFNNFKSLPIQKIPLLR